MQLIDESGSARELEGWEAEALETAQRAHEDATGVVRQYDAAKAERLLREALINSVEIPEADAVRMVSLYPAWKAGEHYGAGTRLRYADALYRVLQDHESQDGWRPDAAPSLYARVLPGQSGEVGEWVQPDSTNGYSKGDKVTHGGKTWVSLVGSNVWEPGATGTESCWEEA